MRNCADARSLRVGGSRARTDDGKGSPGGAGVVVRDYRPGCAWRGRGVDSQGTDVRGRRQRAAPPTQFRIRGAGPVRGPAGGAPSSEAGGTDGCRGGMMELKRRGALLRAMLEELADRGYARAS